MLGVVEYNGAVFSSKGLHIEALKVDPCYHIHYPILSYWRVRACVVQEHQGKKGTLLGFPGAEKEFTPATAMSVLEEECDILVPAVSRGCLLDLVARYI